MAWAHRGDQSARVKSVASRKTGVGGWEGVWRILCQTALNTRDTGRAHSNASTQHSRDRLANKDRHFDPLTSRRVSDHVASRSIHTRLRDKQNTCAGYARSTSFFFLIC